MKIRILSEQKSYIKKGSSAPQIDGQEKAFVKYGNGEVDIVYKSLALKNINRVLKKAGGPTLYEGFVSKKAEDVVYLYIAVSYVFLKENVYLLKRLKENGNKVSIFCYDVWEPEFDDWEDAFRKIDPDYIFFGYKKSMEYFNKKGFNGFWVPLSGDFEVFKPYESEKTRLFMQMGRRNDDLHEKILAYLAKHGIEDNRENYVYAKQKGESIYADIHELAREISKTKYFVCVPKFYENFKRTGNINETICRYYEGMACKTLPIGMKSETFDELFPYKAMISFNDGEDFNEQIEYYEAHPEEYQQIIDKNYDYVMKNHSWGNRIQQILEIVNK